MVIYGSTKQQADPATVSLYHHGLESLAVANYSARPHPGKNNYFSQHLMAAAYPDTFAAFVTLWGQLDPTSKLVNPYLQLLFSTL